MVDAVGEPPRISVVTPSFNQGDFIEATLQSVTGQGYPNLEYVVIDGGSTDGSVDIIRGHEADLAYWVSEPDEGHAHAINKGFARTTGEIMCWINSSDMYYPWTLATIAEIFTQLPEVEWITGMGSMFDVRGGPRAVSSASGTFNVYDVLAGDYRWIQQESVFWRRSLWEQAGGRLDQRLPRTADFDLWLRFFRLAPFHHVQTVLGGFRVHGDRLGDSGDGQYGRDAARLHADFVAGYDRRSLARARLVRALGSGRTKFLGDLLCKAGVLPWYRHPRVVFDFDRQSWHAR
jgi:glycosyltransferase involved in cell wall biosynthesis